MRVDYLSRNGRSAYIVGCQELRMTRANFMNFVFPRRDAALRVTRKPAPNTEQLGRFDAEVQKGLDDEAAGRVKDADEVFDRLDAKYRAIAKRRR